MDLMIEVTLYVILSSVGQIFLKTGAGEIQKDSLSTFFNIKLMSGIFIFGMSFLTWIYILTKANLSYAYPYAVGLSYILVILISALILKEHITQRQLGGIAIVGVGLVLIVTGKM